MPNLADTPLSVLDLAPVRQGGTISAALADTLDLARHVEKLGYNRFWLAEHHNMPGIASSATSVLIGHVAGGTSTIRVGSGGVMLPNHAPIVIAEQFGTLEALYPGRIDLGLGRAPGTDMLTTRALRRDLADDENSFPRNVQELLALLAPAGEGQKVRAVPGSGSNVPVWLLGSSTFSAQLSAMLGLPFAFASHFAPQRLLEAIEVHHHFFRPSEYLDKPYIMVGLPVIAADTDEKAQYLATTTYQRLVNLVRGQPTVLVPPVDSMDGLWDEREKAYVASHLGIAVIGGPETVKSGLQAFLDKTGANELIITSDFYEHADRLRSFEIIKDAARAG
ncbi:LLM class flavin-dependent oxidoreductase [Kaistia dalseonensis]|uniref:Luciferase family oxidoreductase group 1 n=1 Tax=Kaistia dalseonensis TaxID=410840 RepID=A0ABU0HDQ8_9HYPH|nr:LLM class flavin-dependent oxidoreductase [Kaistia dalseonensis]MCX5497020.1 LLM class flavin-dependent oxidoreductase [Kaistia dalseonensis]MDQ0439646.1 luciferase family oxidoreductase group 1 [Kaistia dalseonensis]